MSDQLAIPELSECEALALTQEIRDNVDNVAELLKKAHDGKAWVALKYQNWDAYTAAEFQMSKRHANRLVNFENIKELVGPIGPTSEGQARPLTTLETAEQQVKAWGIANERTDGKPTAKDVQAAVEEVKAEPIEADEIEPPKLERVTYQPSNGLMFADNAISQLQKIQPNDTQRTRAFERVAKWLANNK